MQFEQLLDVHPLQLDPDDEVGLLPFPLARKANADILRSTRPTPQSGQQMRSSAERTISSNSC